MSVLAVRMLEAQQAGAQRTGSVQHVTSREWNKKKKQVNVMSKEFGSRIQGTGQVCIGFLSLSYHH
jgi:uncharacterized Ntn-hydrolase superfamily protein